MATDAEHEQFDGWNCVDVQMRLVSVSCAMQRYCTRENTCFRYLLSLGNFFNLPVWQPTRPSISDILFHRNHSKQPQEQFPQYIGYPHNLFDRPHLQPPRFSVLGMVRVVYVPVLELDLLKADLRIVCVVASFFFRRAHEEVFMITDLHDHR